MSSYDVIVIGGGPAGATAACRLASLGHGVLLVERQRFPRFHIGESLLPASNLVFETLGLTLSMQAEGFVEKRGATFSTENGSCSSHVDFTACGHIPAPLTYQVERSRFDELLLDHASKKGAEVRQGCRAVDVSFTPDAAVVSIAGEDGRQVTATASYLIDGSGQSGFLAKRLSLRRPDAGLKNVSLYAWYEGVARPAGARAGDIRIISRRDMSWIWLIPLTSGLTSIGIVLPRAQHAARDNRRPVSDLLESYLASTAVAAEQMRLATRVSEVRTEADFSYEPKTYVGRRWLLAGDAGSFLDPVFSSGVLLALESGLEAAETVHRSLHQTDRARWCLVSFNRKQRKRYRFYRRFARGFYDPAFRDLFFQTSSRLGLVDDIAVALAGHWQAPWQRRLKLRMFFMMVFLQRWIAIAPRTHSSSRFRRAAEAARTT